MKDDTDYVQRNIEAIRSFYDSKDYNDLKTAGKIKIIESTINKMYIDPDVYDISLYKRLSSKLDLGHVPGKCELYNDAKIRLSSDAVCGWKQLYKLWKGDISWLNDYKAMRKYTAAYLVWPRHKVPTINTLRYKVFNDRVDYTLFDISKFFDCKKIYNVNKNMEQFENNVRNTCKLHKAYLNPNGSTYDWLMTFHGFKELVDKMQLNRFVNMLTYNVINLEEGNNEITDYCKSYSFNDKYCENLKIKLGITIVL